jgi:hypothetical protein
VGRFPGLGRCPRLRQVFIRSLRPRLYGVFQVTQPLSQRHKIGLNIRLAKLNQKLNAEKLRAQKQLVGSQAMQAYYAKTQSAIEVSRKNLELDRELQRLMQPNVPQKTALKSDEMDVSAKLAQEEYNQLMLGNALETQKEQLNQLLGRDVRTAFSVGATSEPANVEMDLESARAITVGATVLALFALAMHGGPLWKPLCDSQIGGLGVATFITLLRAGSETSEWEGPTETASRDRSRLLDTAVQAGVAERRAVGFESVLDDAHGLAIRQKLPGPPIDHFATALERAFDVVLVIARQEQDGIGARKRSIAAVERSTIGEVELLSVCIVGIEDEGQTFGRRLDFVNGAPPGTSILIVQCVGIELPGANEGISSRSHKPSIL